MMKDTTSEKPMLDEAPLIEAKLNGLLNQMTEGWRRGSGTMFAQPFSKEARFVAFDGSIHHGPDEIAAFH